MRRVHLLGSTLVSAAALGLAACQDNPNPTSPDAVPSFSMGAGQVGGLPSAAEFNRQVPGFGGFYLDANGEPVVYLNRGASQAAAARALAGYLSARGLSTAAVHVLEAKYSWQQLERWQGDVTAAAFDGTGAVFVDDDETSNQVRVGVEDLGAMGRIRAAAAQLGVPTDAIVLERAEPIVMVANLQNVVDRPVRAGVQINFPGFLCSVGFNAISNGQASFVTASHCTNTQGGVESTPYWQPLQSVDPTQIATEVDDPVYVRGQGQGRNNPCPKSRRCRYSDSSREAYIDPGNMALGLIAQTTGANNGDLTIAGSFSITSDDCGGAATIGGCLAVGNTVNKVGRTTGWTQGQITNTCVNTGVSGTNIVQLCQTFVSAGVGAGDSGSDVFAISGGNNVTLAGILWGGSGSSLYVFSPLGNVVSELGPLTTH